MRVVLDHITKRFADVTAVSEFNATLEDGELVSLLGPSGCGKSTLLNMLSGILPVSGGKIYFDDQDVTTMPPEKRGIGLVFQNYALYPHMTVMGNICFPLETQRVPKAERIERANEIAKLVHVDMLMNRKPSLPTSRTCTACTCGACLTVIQPAYSVVSAVMVLPLINGTVHSASV